MSIGNGTWRMQTNQWDEGHANDLHVQNRFDLVADSKLISTVSSINSSRRPQNIVCISLINVGSHLFAVAEMITSSLWGSSEPSTHSQWISNWLYGYENIAMFSRISWKKNWASSTNRQFFTPPLIVWHSTTECNW